MTNSRVTATSKVFVTVGSGCQTDPTMNTIVLDNVKVEAGLFTAYFLNDDSTKACTSAFKFYYFVLN